MFTKVIYCIHITYTGGHINIKFGEKNIPDVTRNSDAYLYTHTNLNAIKKVL